jgi:hypothetical protein
MVNMKHSIKIALICVAVSVFFSCPPLENPPPASFTFSVSSDGHGTVARSPEGAEFQENASITVVSAPAQGYKFDAWTDSAGAIVSASNPYTFQISANTTLIATHSILTVHLTGSVSGPGTISVSPSGTNAAVVADDFQSGTSITVTAVPGAGSLFLRWEGSMSGTTNPMTFPIINDMTISAVFASSTATTYSLTTAVNPAGAGAVSPATGRYVANSTVTLRARPGAGYAFLNWDGGSTDSAYTTPPLTADTLVTANFQRVYRIMGNSTNGTIELDPDKEYYAQGEVVAVTAVPSDGYAFAGWSGGLSGTDRITTVTVGTSDISIAAAFAERRMVLVHFAVDNNIDYDFEDASGYVSDYLATLESVEASDVNDVLDIFLLMDCYDSFPGYTSPFADGYFELTGGPIMGDLVQATGEIDSGSVDVTRAFADWAFARSNARKVIYSVFNHGSGFDDQNADGTYGIGFDDSADDSLSHKELEDATAYIKAKAGRNLEIFFPYACLMGGVELAWQVRENADILLFSEEVFPADYWSYEGLASIIADPMIDGAGIATAFCDSAYGYFSGISREFTLSAIDLSEIQPLYDSIDGFASAAIAWIGNDHDRAAVLDAAAFTSIFMNTPYYTDLGYFMNRVDASTSEFASDTTAVRNAISNAVIYQRHNGGNYANVSGITIFHNIWLAMDYGYYYDPAVYGSILSFGTANAWTEYAAIHAGLYVPPAPDAYEPDGDADTIANVLAPGLANAQTHTFYSATSPTDYDNMIVNLTAGQTYTFETMASTKSCDTYMNLLDANRSTNLASDDDSGVGLYSKITYTAVTTGIHYLRIREFSGQPGDYQVYYDAGSWGGNGKDGALKKLPWKTAKAGNFWK